MKILPINEETSLRTYTYYSYLDAMIHNEYRTGDTRAKVRVLDYEKYEWSFFGDKLRMELQDGNLNFIREGGSTSLNGILFRELMKQDKIELEILYQQYSQPWGSISIFISEEDVPEVTSFFPYQIGNFCKTGCFVKDSNGNQININRKLSPGDRLVLKREGERITFGYRAGNTGEFSALHECEIEKQFGLRTLKIGIGVFLYDNVYYEWLYANHIQWRYHKEDREIPFEFETSIERNWSYYIANYFVTYKTENLKMLRELKLEMKEYLKACLRDENYVELRMDSFYLKGTAKCQQCHFFHACLIYGYNDEENVFYVLCVSQGKPFLSTISYEDFDLQAQQYHDDILLVSQKYDPEGIPYELKLEDLICGLRCYLEGRAAFDTGVLIPKGECAYGIDVYDRLIQENTLHRLMNDKRMGYLIYEHKECMYNRLKYVVERGLVEDTLMQPVLRQMKEIRSKALEISDLVLMYLMRPMERFVVKVRTRLQELKEMEQKLYPILIKLLETEKMIL